MIIGRKKELEQLRTAFDSDEAQLVAVYGRRRIGKTFLVRNAFDNSFTFTYSGTLNISNRDQLALFHDALVRHGANNGATPASWFEAFGQLRDLIEKSTDKRKVIFIDEMPWMDAPRSKFVPALESFWNGWASGRNDILIYMRKRLIMDYKQDIQEPGKAAQSRVVPDSSPSVHPVGNRGIRQPP